MYTKCVYSVPLSEVDTEFPLKKAALAISGTVHTKYLYSVLLTGVDIEFAIKKLL